MPVIYLSTLSVSISALLGLGLTRFFEVSVFSPSRQGMGFGEHLKQDLIDTFAFLGAKPPAALTSLPQDKTSESGS